MHELTPPKHILVYADDDDDDLMLVKEAMAVYKDSVEVSLFESGLDAYEFLLNMEKRSEKPCLILLDMNMPGMSGKELLPILRSIPFFDDVPISLFTTSSSHHDYQFALHYNAGFITKPMNFKQIDVIAEQFLSHCNKEVREMIGGRH
ncbi:MAG TPA: response regulator [Flavisolibacter sp.]|jgi:CheY-like chemotaxis protein|nr:response regulator [Flavisolibacter sp.]